MKEEEKKIEKMRKDAATEKMTYAQRRAAAERLQVLKKLYNIHICVSQIYV